LSLIGSNTYLSTLFTVNAPTSMSESEAKEKLYFLYSNRYDCRQQMRIQKVIDWIIASMNIIQFSLRISSWIKFVFVAVVPKYLKCDTFSNHLFAIFISRCWPVLLWRGSSIRGVLSLLYVFYTPTSILGSIQVAVILFIESILSLSRLTSLA
jgi:hypothetical protein